jgi:hypothetical protein
VGLYVCQADPRNFAKASGNRRDRGRTKPRRASIIGARITPRLAGIKAKYDPDGLFTVHHGVGGEAWSDDGFTRRA